jgi:Tol biopolymer transport system component
MTLSSGTRLGPYEIQAAIGAGGMGEVYKARDTRLDRSVAIKVLPAHVSADPERRARFEREAKTIAGLNHPHICTLYDVGEHEGSTFLVMEHLTGETLAQRLEKGPLPPEQALTVTTEIADALAAAHRQGVIHRDLKPGNVMLTKAGTKLLDFGLAKLTGHGEQPVAAHLASAPTQSTPLTGEGMIVGTLQYMAPEQVEGKPADARTDLWALGAILYEMVTGKRAFEGTSAASLIGAILEREPASLTTLQPLTPPGVDRLVRRCLAKSPDDRWDSAHDVADELRWVRETSGVVAPTGVHPQRRRGLRTALVVAGGLLLILAGAGLMWLLRPPAPRPSLARLSLDVRPAEALNAGGAIPPFIPTPGGSRTALTWTPDGQALVYVGRRGGVQQLYVRRLDAAEARPLAGTEGAQVPAVSPDGQWVAFWAQKAIRKVSLDGGPVMDLAAGLAEPPWGLVWDARGRVFFGRDDGRIWEVPPEGVPKAVTSVGDAEAAHVLPWVLPGERVLLYTVRKRVWSWGDDEIVAHTLATGKRTVVLRDAADARYVSTGHLVFLRRGVLFAAPFDAERSEVRGTPVAVLDAVAQALTAGYEGDTTGAGQFAVAVTGTLAWLPGPVAPYPDRALVTVDRRGQVSPLPAPVRSYGPDLRLSPDGRRLAVTIKTLAERGLWLYDLGRGILTPLAGSGEANFPVWAPDGQRLVFGWLKDGRRSLAVQSADGTAPPQVLVARGPFPSSFTRDGRQLAAVRAGDIVMVTVEHGKASVQPLSQTPHTEQPTFSPDGRWLAYGSDVSGRNEVYVRPYPGPGPAEQVSLEGGRDPAWHPNGRELFYVGPLDGAGKRRIMAVEFAPGSPPRIGTPRRLFEFDPRDLNFGCTPLRCYDVAPDGQRFYVTQTRPAPPPPVVTHINLIQNWLEGLKAKVPTGR